MLRSDLCDYGDTYIVVKGTIDLLTDAANKNDKVYCILYIYDICIVATKYLIVRVHGVLLRTLLEMLKLLVLIIVHHLMLTTARTIFSARSRSNFRMIND